MKRQTGPSRLLAVLTVATLLLWASSLATAAIVSWDGGGPEDYWDIAANWSADALPGAADDVQINIASAQTVTHRSGTDIINSLNSPVGGLAFTGGSLTVSGTYYAMGTTTISGGSLILNGVSSLGGLTMTSGTLGGTGTVTPSTFGISITGGTVAMTGGGVLRNTGTANFGTFTNAVGSMIELAKSANFAVGTITDNGAIALTAGATDTDIRLTTGNVTLTGSGTLTMSSTGAGSARIIANNSTYRLTNAAGHTIQGSGNIGVSAMALTNQGTIIANQSNPLIIEPSASGFTNTGTVQANAGSTLRVTNNLTNFSGTTLTGGTYNVYGTSGSPGTMRLATANIVTNAATILLDGPNSNLLQDDGLTNALANFATNSATGSFTIQNGRNFTTAGAFSNAGTLTVGTASTFTVTGALTLSGGTLGGTGTVTVAGLATWTGGTMTDAGTTTLQNGLALSGTSNRNLNGGRTLTVAGTSTWTGGGQILAGGGATLNNQGLWQDQATANTTFNNYFVGGATFNNTGTYRKSVGTGTTTVGIAFNNTSSGGGTGVVDVQTGSLLLTGGGTANSGSTFTGAAGTTLGFGGGYTLQAGSSVNAADVVFSSGTNAVAGSYTATGTTFSGGTTTFTSAPTLGALTIANTAANFNAPASATSATLSGGTLGGTGTVTVAGLATWTGGTMTDAGTTTLQNGLALSGTSNRNLNGGRTLTVAGTSTWTGGGQILAGGGATLNNQGLWQDQATANTTFNNYFVGGATFNNTGTYTKSGGPGTTTTVGINFANSGTVNVNEGTMAFNAGIQGASGTLQIGSAGAVSIGAESTVGTLAHNGSAAGSLNLGTRNLTVSSDYTNANFGAGNTFNARANVTGTGQILAAGNVGQAVTGASITGGTTATPTLTIGNVHVGANTFTYQVANIGTTGPALRGALQTGVNGGNITDGRLSGTGVTAANFGPLAAGANSGALAVTFTAPSAGTLSPLAGQLVHIANNFDNVADQNLSVVLGTGAAAYRLAQATINNAANFNFGSVLVGSGPITRTLSISNTATADGFSEALNAAFGSFTNNGAGIFANNGGTITGLLAGQTNATAMTVTMTPTSAGTVSASVAVQFASNGTAIGNGLGVTALPAQDLPLNVTITGVVGNLAQASAATPNPVNFGKFRVGDAAPADRVLSLGNVAVAPAEGLNASIATASSGFSATGAFSSLAPGATNTTSLQVGFNGTGTAGAKAGTATITLVSDGTFNSGVPTPLSPQTINMNAEVYRLATASAHTPEPVTLANQRVGGTATQAVSLTNTAATDGYSERLNASIAPTTGQATASGTFALLAAGATNTTGLRVGVDTATAGAKSGTATITLASDGTGTSGFGALGIGTQTVNVQGNVYQVAQPTAVTPNPVVLANQHVGGTLTQALTLTNTSAAPPGFQEGLNANFSGTTGTATASGTITNLAQGATNTTSLQVGVDTATAGAKSGTATLALASNGTVSGLADLPLATQTVTVSGNVYRLAAPNTIASVNFGSVHVGDTVTQALTIQNTAAADGFSERLNASFGSVSDPRITTGGAINLLAAGATDSSSMVVGLNTAAAGTVSGTATVRLQSDGTGTSGLGTTNLPDQNVGVAGVIATGDVYRLAQASAHTPEPVAFGNVRINSTQQQALTISNIAPNDGFSEKLNASIATNSPGVVTAAGSFALLAPQATDSSSLVVGLTTASAGAKSGTATITLQSDGTGTSGLGVTPLPSQTVNISGNVFRLAAGGTGDLNLGSFHVGANASGALTVTNTATNDGYSEKLNASVTGFTPAVTGASGSVSLLAAGSSATTISATLGNVQAGVNSGTVSLAYQSDGAGTTGAPAIGVGTQTVSVQATGYRLANPVINNPGAFNFGNVHVGDPVQQALSITNSVASDGYSEKLNASFGGTSDARITTSGSIALLGAGITDASSMVLGVNTGAAGMVNGTAKVTLASDGTGTSGLGITALPSQDVTVTATIEGGVYRLANPVIQTPQPIAFGNVRLGTAIPAQALAIKNDVPADGFSEKLNASANGTTGGVTATGAFTLLAPQDVNNTSILVGLDTAVAGNRSGVATIAFVSDGTGTSGLGQTPLLSQNVQVTGAVFRLANPVVNTPTVTLAARVGDASPTAGISLTNSSPDIYTEGLKASINTVPAGFTNAGGSIANLAAQGTDAGTLRVGLGTTTAGSYSGDATLTLASTGTGTTGAPDLGLTGQNVNLSGKVYTPAVASATPASLNFGIVHVGDVVAQKAIAVTNSAPGTALNDTLTGSVSASGPFTASGTLGAGVAAGATDSSSLKVGLNTATAGVYTSSATLQFQSHNPDMSDLALANQTVSLAAQVNNYARPVFEQVAGGFGFSQSDSTFTLDFGTLIQGTGTATASLGVRNDVTGPADVLNGTFERVGTTAFQLSGFTEFFDIAAGDLFGGLSVGLDTATLGLFDYSLVLHPYGTNAGGFLGSLGDLTLALHGRVVASAAVPEASTLLLLGIGLAGLAGWRWRTRGTR